MEKKMTTLATKIFDALHAIDRLIDQSTDDSRYFRGIEVYLTGDEFDALTRSQRVHEFSMWAAPKRYVEGGERYYEGLITRIDITRGQAKEMAGTFLKRLWYRDDEPLYAKVTIRRAWADGTWPNYEPMTTSRGHEKIEVDIDC
jgi:hypothetical protein